MTVWYHPNFLFRNRHKLLMAVIILLCVVLGATFFASSVARAAPNTTKTMSFQGRLLASSGAVVPDGHYNIQFKIYQNGSGKTAGNPGGSLQWTESYVNGNSNNGVEVKNGYFSVDLGSRTSFGTKVDWNQDKLFLSMNVAGNANACSTFGGGPCSADGEMLPMKRMSATPMSLNSQAVGGKTADDLIQLGQGIQVDDSNQASININKTGSGNLVQLQSDGTDTFTVNNAGSVTLGSATDQSLTVAQSSTGVGKTLTVASGDAATGSDAAGGDLILQGGAGDGTGKSGDVIVAANGSDSTGTFQVQNTAGDAVFAVNAATGTASIGGLHLSSSPNNDSKSVTSLWGDQNISGIPSNDGTPLNLGLTFKSSQAGHVTGVKFYNASGANNSTGDIGKLWSCKSAMCSLDAGGTELASVTFQNDPSTGWKTATFDSPIEITPDTYYMVTHYTPQGIFYRDSDYFGKDYSNAPLTASNDLITTNGSYAENSGAAFPDDSYAASNYWVDPLFKPSSDTDQITTDNNLLISSGGSMTIGPAIHSLTMQGSSIDIAATNGGDVNVQGGDAATADSNGGNLKLGGGKGNGTGVNGLVLIDTPTFTTTGDDSNCFTGGSLVANNCTIAASSVNNSAVITVGFSATGKVAIMPDPTIKTAGRIMYVTAANGSKAFILRANPGAGAGVEHNINLSKNTTATLLWNGADWTIVGGGNSASLQDAFNSSPQDAGGANVIVNQDGSTGGLAISDNAENPVNNTILEVNSVTDNKLFSVNSNGGNYASNGDAEVAGATGEVLPTNTWGPAGGATISRHTTAGDNIQTGKASVKAVTSAEFSGAYNKLNAPLTAGDTYDVTLSARLETGSHSDFSLFYVSDGASSNMTCLENITITDDKWTKINCTFQTPTTGITADNTVALGQTTTDSRTVYIDNLSVTPSTGAMPNVKIGSNGKDGDATTLFTLDKAASAPTKASDNAMVGSMYYDTTVGKVQCFEAEGWGSCGASPDSFITISPEYTNAVMNGADNGTITSDLCSDSLNINDGSGSQPAVCGTNETHNFYNWTTTEASDQTRSIFVTYQLPSNFKKFVAGSTSLSARTDHANSSVSYRVYRDSATGAGLTSCGSAITASSGSKSSWQKAIASGGADPSACDFEAGDSILFRINLTAKDDANAYVSNLGFVFTNN